MKFTSSYAWWSSLVPLAGAFPAAVMEQAAQDPSVVTRANEIFEQLQERQSVKSADAATAIFEPVPMFNENQLIDVSDSGPNAWMAPTSSDLRGPCPGLNAFANHGFLPRNGYATITQFVEATTQVVGMGPQLAAFLAVLGASIDGDGTSWSIGGTPPVGIGGPLSSRGRGISGSHNKYESDASPTRPDLYQTGNDWKTMPKQFNQMIASAPSGFVDLNTLTNFRSQRFDHQVQTNPYFFNGPFTGVLVQPAAYTFIYRFMANHSEEYKVGQLSHSVLASWFGMTKKGNSYVLKNGKLGQERIPYNWYKRADAYPYDNEYFLADAANAIALHPKFANIGGNTGKANSFTGINVANFSGGVINGKNLMKGNNFACLAYQFAAQATPDVLLGSATNNIFGALSPILSALSCPTLEKLDKKQLESFPGYKKSNV